MPTTFDGSAKRVYIDSLEPNVSVQELYSDWKEWALQGNNLGFAQAFRTFGGDPTVEGQTAPAYYFLTNGWRVVVDGFYATFSYNLYTDEGENPIITLNGGTSLLNNSDVGIVKTELDESLDYDGTIYIDAEAVGSGAVYPYGTVSQPVNNIQDANALSATYGINFYHVVTRETELLLDADIPNKGLIGFGHDGVVRMVSGYDYEHLTVEKLTIRGDAGDNHMHIEDCEVESLLNFSGHLIDCTLEGNLVASGTCVFKDCASHEFGEVRPSIAPSAGDLTVAFRNYSGGLYVRNVTSGNTSLGFGSGKLIIEPTCVGGYITARGMVLVDDQSAGTVVDTTATVSSLAVNTDSIRDELEVINEGVKKSSLIIPHNTDLP